MRLLKILGVIVVALAALYFFGPHPAKPVYTNLLPTISDSGAALDGYVANLESRHPLKKNNEARIVWANDSLKNTTEYAIVYLHGFSASQEEGNPVHRNIAKAFGCNLYLARLAQHGIDTTDALYHFTAEELWET